MIKISNSYILFSKCFTFLFSTLITILLCCVLFTPNSYAAPGDADSSLGSGSGYQTYSASGSIVWQTIPLSDGSIISGGTFGSPATSGLYKINYNGSVDTGYGTSGISKNSAWGIRFTDVAATKNDKVVAVGINSSNQLTFGQFNTNGSIDTGFGSGIRTLGTSDLGGTLTTEARVFVGTDDKIYICAGATDAGKWYTIIKRYNKSGSLDTTYGSSGLVKSQMTTTTSGVSTIGFDIDRGNTATGEKDKIVSGIQTNTKAKQLLGRFKHDGSLDNNFGTSGWSSITLIGGAATIQAGFDDYIRVDDNNRIIFGGYVGANQSVHRVTNTGILDTSFSTDGQVSLTPYSGTTLNIRSILPISTGGIVIMGMESNANTTTSVLNNDGSYNTSFNTDGRITKSYGSLVEVNVYSVNGWYGMYGMYLSGVMTRIEAVTGPAYNESKLGQGKNGNQDSAGDPVNLVTGNVYSNEQDFNIAGRGPALSWMRTYNSQSISTSHIGRGWTDIYNSRLSFNGDGSITQSDPQGAFVKFASNGSGGFNSPDGTLSILTVNGGGGYDLTMQNKVIWHYNDDGLLTTITDSNGNVLTLSYTSGLLTTITNDSGRTLTLTYNSDDLVTEIEDDASHTYEYDYDSNNSLIKVTDPKGNETNYEYYSDTLYLKNIIEDGTVGNPGNTQHFVYDALGRATSASGSNGVYAQTFGYGVPSANHTTVTDTNGDTVYTYDASGQVTNIKDPYNKDISYEWTDGQKTKETDQLGNETTYEYNTNGSLKKVTQPIPKSGGSHPVTEYEYADSSFPYSVTKETNPEGGEIINDYDSNGNLLTQEGPNGGITTFTYNGEGQVLTKETPNDDLNGTSTTYSYDTNGDLLTITRPPQNVLGSPLVTTYTYDSLGRKETSETAMGKVTDYDYDANNNVTKITDPPKSSGGSRRTIDFMYDERDNVISRQVNAGSSGPETTYEYNEQNKILVETSPEGKTKSYTYDDYLKPLTIEDNDNNVTEYEYDDVERLISITQPDGTMSGAETTTAYTDTGLPETITDPNGNITTRSYDDLGRLSGVQNALMNNSAYEYDQNGNLLSVADLGGKTTSYTYDDDGNVLTKTLPGALNGSGGLSPRVYSYEYDGNGNKTQQTDPNGKVTNYIYNQVDELIQKDFPSSSSPTLEWQYNEDGQVTQTDDGTGTTTYDYNDRGELTSKNLPGSGSPKIEYDYDLIGNVVSKQLPKANDPTTFDYNDDGQLISLTDPGSNQTDYSYDVNGNLSDVEYANGAKNSYVYDEMQRVTQIKNYEGDGSTGLGTKTNELNYDYDKASNIVGIEDKNSNDVTLTYDDANRLTHQEIDTNFMISGSPSVDNAYTYSAGGNILQLAQTGSNVVSNRTTDYTYNSQDQLASADNSVTGVTDYSYDDNGQLTSLDPPGGSPATTNFTYDVEGHLLTAGADTYEYDINGARVQTSNSVTSDVTKTTFDVDGNVVQQELNGGSTGSGTTTNYEHGPEGTSQVGSQDASGNYDATSYYAHDVIGSVTGLTNADPGVGSSTDQYSYDVFGGELDRAGTSMQPFGYVNNMSDAGSANGLLNFNAREYDPSVGRFLSTDPVKGNPNTPETFNSYSYGANNPFSNTDPSGMAFQMQYNNEGYSFGGYNIKSPYLTKPSPAAQAYQENIAASYYQNQTYTFKIENNSELATLLMGLYGVERLSDLPEGAFRGSLADLYRHVKLSSMSDYDFQRLLSIAEKSKALSFGGKALGAEASIFTGYLEYKKDLAEGHGQAYAVTHSTSKVVAGVVGAAKGCKYGIQLVGKTPASGAAGCVFGGAMGSGGVGWAVDKGF